jgi:hypothetical protein
MRRGVVLEKTEVLGFLDGFLFEGGAEQVAISIETTSMLIP